MRRIIIGHAVAWLLGVAFMSLFIGDAFNWSVHPLVIAAPLVVAAIIRSWLFRRRERAADSTSA